MIYVYLPLPIRIKYFINHQNGKMEKNYITYFQNGKFEYSYGIKEQLPLMAIINREKNSVFICYHETYLEGLSSFKGLFVALYRDLQRYPRKFMVL